MKRKTWEKRYAGLLPAAPALAGFAVFYFVPFLIMVWYSLSFGMGKRTFVGLANFRELFENEMFLLAVRNTCRFLAVGVSVILVLSFLLAWLLSRLVRGEHTFKMIYLYPMVVPIASVVLIVQFLWGDTGIANRVLELMGKESADWLHSSRTFWVLCILYWWKFTGYHVLIFFARLQMLPKEYFESARLDGAGTGKILRYVTLPLMAPVFLFNLLLAVMNAFKCYREAFLLGGNYPHDSIYLLQHFMNNSFESLNYQKISAASVTLMAGILLLVLAGGLLYTLTRRGKHGRTKQRKA